MKNPKGLALFYYGIWAVLLTGGAPCGQAQIQDGRSDSNEVWSYHFQFTGIGQAHPAFHAAYSGQNSLQQSPESPFSVTSTLFLGRRLWSGGEAYFNPEMSGGSGFSRTTGIAGFPNGEVYRVDAPTPRVFVARAFLRQNFAIGDGEAEYEPPDQNQLGEMLPSSRLTLTLGKFSLTDLFDDNAYSHDPRTQLLNWALWTGGAWDYAADTRGYNWGIAGEWYEKDYTLRAALVMVPTTANGPEFDTHLDKAHSVNVEFVEHHRLFDTTGTVHVIAFLNRAHMGLYREALTNALATGQPPDVTTTRAYRTKAGFLIGVEQPLSETIGIFGRISWNDGSTETWAFTEIDRSYQLGLCVNGKGWGRREDVVSIAGAVNGLSSDHRAYLAAGGYGFIIGDGALNYAPELICEVSYDAKLLPTFWLTVDNQVIVNPAYNNDRGPVVEVFAVRGHVAF